MQFEFLSVSSASEKRGIHVQFTYRLPLRAYLWLYWIPRTGNYTYNLHPPSHILGNDAVSLTPRQLFWEHMPVWDDGGAILAQPSPQQLTPPAWAGGTQSPLRFPCLPGLCQSHGFSPHKLSYRNQGQNTSRFCHPDSSLEWAALKSFLYPERSTEHLLFPRAQPHHPRTPDSPCTLHVTCSRL